MPLLVLSGRLCGTALEAVAYPRRMAAALSELRPLNKSCSPEVFLQFEAVAYHSRMGAAQSELLPLNKSCSPEVFL